jgi:hypothetical protein
MKKSKYLAGMLSLGLALALIFTGCPDSGGGDIIRKSPAGADNSGGSDGSGDGGSGSGGGSGGSGGGSDEPAVTGVALSPLDGTAAARGGELRFAAEVRGTAGPSGEAVWSLEGARSGGTRLNQEGVLQVAPDETAPALTVKAAAAADLNRSASVTVTVTDAQAPLVTGVSVNGPADAVQGGTAVFTALADGLLLSNRNVTWSLEGGSPGTALTQAGPNSVTLYVSLSETPGTVLTLAAVSQADQTKSCSFPVTVIPAPGSAGVSIEPELGETDLILPGGEGPYAAGFTISGPPGYDSYSWSVDGFRQTGTGPAFQVNVQDLDAGFHSVTLIAEKEGMYYSAAAAFRIAR